MNLKEAKKRLKINLSGLDQECKEQASLYYEVSEKHAFAVSRRDQAHNELKDVMSKLDLKIRKNPEDFDLSTEKKPTEAAISATVALQKEYQKAHTRFTELKEEAVHWANMKDAFLQRASALKMSCELWISNYYSDVVVKSPSKHDVVSDAAEERIRKKRMERPRRNRKK